MADDFWDSIINTQVSFDIETLPDGTRRPIRRPVNIAPYQSRTTVTGRIEPHQMPIQTYRAVERLTEPMWREVRFITDEEMPRDSIIAVDSRQGEPTTVTVSRWAQIPAVPNRIRAEIQRVQNEMRSRYMDSINMEPGVSEAPPPPPPMPEPPPEEVPMPQFAEGDNSLIARLGRLNMTREQRIQHINMMGAGSTPNAIRVQFYNLLTSRGVRQSRGWF